MASVSSVINFIGPLYPVAAGGAASGTVPVLLKRSRTLPARLVAAGSAASGAAAGAAAAPAAAAEIQPAVAALRTSPGGKTAHDPPGGRRPAVGAGEVFARFSQRA